MKSPYNFDAKSRIAMVDYMRNVGSRYYRPWRYPFAFDVKIGHLIYNQALTAEALASHNPESRPFVAQWDSAFATYAESEGFFDSICEDMARGVDDYCTWPGDDSGDFTFTFEGRSGGWLCLEKWQGIDLRNLDFDDLLADKDSWPFERVRSLYRALVCIVQDTRPQALIADYMAQVAWRRQQWEGERIESLGNIACDVIQARQTAMRLIGEYRRSRLLPALGVLARAEVARLMRVQKADSYVFARLMTGVE